MTASADFEPFVRDQFVALVNFAAAVTSELDGAEEIARDALRSVVASWVDSPSPTDHLDDFEIATRQHIFARNGGEAPSDVDQPTWEAFGDEPDPHLWEAFARLPLSQRSVLALIDGEGRSMSQVAMILGVNERSVEVLHGRGHRVLSRSPGMEENTDVAGSSHTSGVREDDPVSGQGLFGTKLDSDGAVPDEVGRVEGDRNEGEDVASQGLFAAAKAARVSEGDHETRLARALSDRRDLTTLAIDLDDVVANATARVRMAERNQQSWDPSQGAPTRRRATPNGGESPAPDTNGSVGLGRPLTVQGRPTTKQRPKGGSVRDRGEQREGGSDDRPDRRRRVDAGVAPAATTEAASAAAMSTGGRLNSTKGSSAEGLAERSSATADTASRSSGAGGHHRNPESAWAELPSEREEGDLSHMQPLVQLFIAAGVSVLFAGLVIAGANALRSDPETVASPSPTTVGDLASLLEEARAIDEAAEPGVGVISIPGESVTSADPDRPGRGSGPDSSGPDGSGPDGSGPDGSGPDGSGPDGSGPDGSGPDGSGPDGNGVDGSVPGGSTPGGTGPDGGSNPTDPGSSVVPPGEPPGATTPVPGPGSTDPPVARPTDPPSTPAPIGERCGVGGAGGFAEDRRIELDLDGDANADVVQISAPGAGGARTVRVSLGEGSSFSSPLPVPAALDGGDPLRTLAAFDVDVDGDLEVAIRSDRGDEDGTWYLDLDECTPVASRLVNESSGAFGDLVLYERADQGGLSEFGCTTPGDGAPRIVSRSIVLQFDDTGTSTGSTVETTTIDRRSLSTAGTTQTQYRPSEEIPPAPPPCR